MEVATSTADGQAVLAVRNSGEPVPPEDIRGLFEPFRRLGGDRVGQGRGHGLGLSIAAAVVSAHHGEVNVEPLEGGGLSSVVYLPATGRP